MQTLESSNELLERQKVDLHNQIEEVHRDKSDTKYKHERIMFQLKTKEETILQLKTQLKNTEIHFREQIDKVKEDVILSR